MANPVRQNDFAPLVDQPVRKRPKKEASGVQVLSGKVPLSIDEGLPLASPARRMQETLGREFAEVELDGKPWSQRRTIAFIALTCGAFWTLVYFLVAALVG